VGELIRQKVFGEAKSAFDLLVSLAFGLALFLLVEYLLLLFGLLQSWLNWLLFLAAVGVGLWQWKTKLLKIFNKSVGLAK